MRLIGRGQVSAGRVSQVVSGHAVCAAVPCPHVRWLGDPRYLRQALTALADLRTVTGRDDLDTAEPVAATTSAAWDLRKLTTEELQQLETMAEKACARPAD